MISGVCDRLQTSDSAATVDAQQADSMPHQTDDGSLHSPNASTPNPSSPTSLATSRPSTTTPIDLTSPTRQSRTFDRRNTQTRIGRSRLLKNQRSVDEKRLTGDYEYEGAHTGRRGYELIWDTAYPLILWPPQTQVRTSDRQWSRCVTGP